MLRLYALIIILAVLGGVGYGAFWYYKDTQARIATLRENNAKLEVAVQTAQASVEKMQADVQRLGKLNTQLSKDLQKAEEYGDALRGKLAKLDLVRDALKDAKDLEGRMNGASAKLWREIIGATGGDSNRNLPGWLQPNAGKASSNSTDDNVNTDTNSSKTKTSPAQ